MIVGEGGVSPEYFLYKMQWWEVNRYLPGMHRRYRSTFRAARMLQWWLACMFHAKDKTPPNHPKDLYQFEWEEEEHQDAPVMSEEEAQKLQEEMDRFMW